MNIYLYLQVDFHPDKLNLGLLIQDVYGDGNS